MKIPTPFPVIYIEFGLFAVATVGVNRRIFATSFINMSLEQIFNLGEGILWIMIAGYLLLRSRWDRIYRMILIGGSVTFLFFGISDFIEMQTGAWYRPWWLFAFKALCVISLIAHFSLYLQIKRRKE